MAITWALIFGLILIAWWFVKKKYSYWENRGVPFIKPIIPFGNLKGVGKTVSMKDFVQDIYAKYKGTASLIGGYFFCEPVAIVTDMDLIRNILIKDFSYFQDRKVYYNEKLEPMSAHMFNLEGEKWRLVRQKLSPTFTSGRIKKMFPMVLEVANRFIDLLNPIVAEGSVVEIRDLLMRFTIDVSGTIIYGIECNSMKDPDTEFRLKGRRIFNNPRHGELARLFMETFPEMARILRMKQFADDVTDFFMKIIRQTIEYRESNDVHRNDFMDLLIQLKNTGTLEGHDGQIGKISDEEIAAQAFIFFAGGFETTASTMGFVLYALCLNQEIQDRVRKEIGDVIEEHGGKFTYDAMMSMKYLHRVVDETLRIYSQATYLFRKVAHDYAIPGSKTVLEKDTVVIIPVAGFNIDPEIYPNPEVFDPDNFLPERIAQRDPFTYMPFGEGPRNCIGSRLAKMVTYAGLVTLLQNYRFKPSEKTPVPIEYEPDVQVLKSKTDFYFFVEKL
ncbi:unnamed protein product [Hermetia illucens]|uniref:Cytochrome P450 n=1 Tax=Hermetia illucens TaxID=343691 RepID=A0A7R8YRZ4_HERIL|nr:cytochrome P450 6a8-like [Hermetia illucens]CAD7080009.1 unnamed protein product [Hermetia illucens]